MKRGRCLNIKRTCGFTLTQGPGVKVRRPHKMRLIFQMRLITVEFAL